VLNANLTSAYAVASAAIPSLKRRGGGRIINMSSVAAFTGGGGGAGGIVPYAAAKGGIEGLTKSLAREVAAAGITVNAVAPGYISDTALHATLTAPELEQEIVSELPVRRAGTSDEVGAAVVFLASPAAGFITGETLVLDGGMRIR
jgi:3-oxoacyl-[acyl-carrier protein] reductase